MVHTSHLLTYVTVVQSGSITGAACELHYAQSTVTAHIQALERAVGALLLFRSCTGVSVTPEGERMYGYARGVCLLLEDAIANVGRRDEESDAQSPGRRQQDALAGHRTIRSLTS